MNKIINFLNNAVLWTALSSVATFAAVCVALWQTKFTNRKKIKLKFNVMILYDALSSEQGELISLTAINIGNRRVIINSCAVKVKKKLSYQIMSERCKIIPVSLPSSIEPEESINLYIEKYSFIKMCREIREKHPWQSWRRIEFCIIDSTSKVYSIKIKQTFNHWAKEKI